MLKNRKYLVLSASLAGLILFLYPFLQVLPQGLHNFGFWFSLLTPLRWFLYLSYGVLFGLAASFTVFSRREKVCPVPGNGSGAFGGLGVLLGIILPQCQACFSLAAIFLPFSAIAFLATHLVEFMAISIILLLLSLWIQGAFQKKNSTI